MSIANTKMRLPPLKVLRVRNPNQQESNPCVTVMSSVLGTRTSARHAWPSHRTFCSLAPDTDTKYTACWASAGYNTTGCAAVEQALRSCMDGPAPPPKPRNNINYHLSRMHKKIGGPRKHKAAKD